MISVEGKGSLSAMAPAKINLFLQVMGKRDDGFHDINSAFQAVSLYDSLHFCRRSDRQVNLTITGAPGLAADDTNLVIKTWKLMAETFLEVGGVDIELQKEIPMEAGLGGGSSDAASTIMAANMLHGINLNDKQMSLLGSRMGSDVPFFFAGGQAIVSGRGEIVESCSLPLDYTLLFIKPPVSVSTAQAYSRLNLGLTNSMPPFTLTRCRSAGELVDSLRRTGNDFERVIRKDHPVVDEALRALEESGASLARMSGSGPAVFGIFEEPVSADLHVLAGQRGWQIYEVEPIRYPGMA